MGMRNRRQRRKDAPYLVQVLEASRRLPPGRVYTVDVLHDDTCPLLTKAGPCNCNPTVTTPHPVPAPEDN